MRFCNHNNLFIRVERKKKDLTREIKEKDLNEGNKRDRTGNEGKNCLLVQEGREI